MDSIKNIKIQDSTSFTDLVDIVYLTQEDSTFSLTENGFLTLVSTKDVKPEKLFDDGDGENAPPSHFGGFGGGKGPRHSFRRPECEIKYTDDGKRDYGRVILHRAFPFDSPDKVISVQQEDGFEIGVIRDINDFDDKTAKILRETLDRKYFVPEIKKIVSTKDRFGFVYFKCETDCGFCEFVVRNPFGSIIRVSETKIFIIDIDGNRYSVKDVSKLDKKSYRKIELYI
jgi:hypothetical protein